MKNLLRRWLGYDAPREGVVLYIWPDGRMAVQTGGAISTAAFTHLRDSLEQAQAAFQAGKPLVFDGYIQVVRV